MNADTGPFAFLAFDLPTSQEIAAAAGRLDAVYVRGEPGVSIAELRRSLRADLGPGYDVFDAEQIVRSDNQDVGEFVNLLTGLLLGFAALGVVVGAFIIFNTFTILVTQRTHELGLLRAMGASRRQVITSVVVEAGVVGALASAAGVLLGVVVARLLMSLVDSLGFRIPSGSVVVQPRTVVLAVVVGLVVTVGAALWPAIRGVADSASGGDRGSPRGPGRDVPPAHGRRAPAAERGDPGAAGRHLPRRRRPRTRWTSCRWSDWARSSSSSASWCSSRVFARPLARVFGVPVRAAAGIPGAIARGNAMRNPRRTAATASALVIGLALVAMVAVLGESAKAQIDASDSDVRAELVLDTTQFTGFSPEVIDRVEALPEVTSAVGFHFGRIPIEGQRERIIGINGSGLADAFDLQLEPGSTADIGTDGILVSARRRRSSAGRSATASSLSFPSATGPCASWACTAATTSRSARRSSCRASCSAPRSRKPTSTTAPTRRSRRGSPCARRRRQSSARSRRDFPNIEVQTQDEARDAEADLVDQFLGVLVALLFLSEAIAVLGIVNTLALSVHERTHEIGMLRAVGMTRRQLRRSVRWESVIIAAIGGTVGLALGLVWAWAFTSALETEDLFLLRVPLGRIALLAALSLVAGAIAAVIPAWRASRLQIFDAIGRE